MGVIEYLSKRAEEAEKKGAEKARKAAEVQIAAAEKKIAEERKERKVAEEKATKNLILMGQLTLEQIAEALGVSVAFVKRIKKEMAA